MTLYDLVMGYKTDEGQHVPAMLRKRMIVETAMYSGRVEGVAIAELMIQESKAQIGFYDRCVVSW